MTNYDFLYDKSKLAWAIDRDFFSDRRLSFKVYENATVLPYRKVGQVKWGLGGILDENNTFIPGTNVYVRTGDMAYTPSEPVEYRDETVVYFGMYFPIWGHNLTDNIKRVWFFRTDEYKERFWGCPTIYLHCDDWGIDFHPNAVRLLEILGIDARKLQNVTRPTRFAKVIVPDESWINSPDVNEQMFTEEFRQTIDVVRTFAEKNLSPLPYKKVYFYYGNFIKTDCRGAFTNVVGEERLANYFKSKGFEVISPEQLTFDTQLRVLAGAEVFASTVGSLSHMSTFMRDGTELVLIPRRFARFTDYQDILNQVNEKKVTYVDSSLLLYKSWNGAYFFFVSRQLKRYFGEDADENFDDADLKNFCEYLQLFGHYPLDKVALMYYDAIFHELCVRLETLPDSLKKAWGLLTSKNRYSDYYAKLQDFTRLTKTLRV